MAPEDVAALLLFGGIGALSGCSTALPCRGSRHPFLWSSLLAFVIAILVGLSVSVVLQACQVISEGGKSTGDALKSGLAAAALLSFAMPVACGAPAAIAGIGIQYVLRRFRIGRIPPLPPAR